jgi:carbon monoxide dehydrogenase subunit G
MSKLVRNEFVVRCTPEEAFEFLSDLRNELEWNPSHCQSVEKLTDGPVGRGTKYRAKWKGSPQIEVQYVHFERPRSWQAHSDGSMETNFKCTIVPHADGAKVETELELIPHGLFKLAFPVFRLIFSKHEKASADRIRRTINERYGEAISPQ